MRRRLVAILVVATMAACRAAPGPSAPVRHNVLLVTIDTLRADRLTRALMPTLEALAARGVSFTNARTVAPLTLPAHVSILTGALPLAHGVRLNGVPFGGTPRSLAVRLKEAGYQTGAVVGAFVLDRRFGLDSGFERYDDRIVRDPAAVDRLNAERSAAAVVDASVAWLEHADRARPWLLWTHVYDPHAPYRGNAYDEEVAYVDRELSRLFAVVERLASPAPTAIIVTGDHGESLGEHGEPTHGMLVFEGALRVPLIVAMPGVTPRRVAEPVSLVDIVPTTLALAGVAADMSLAGRNLLGSHDTDREIYAESEYPAVAGWSPVRALVQDRWKAVTSANAALFDLAGDPGERSDLAAARAPLVQAMRARIEAMGKGDAASSGVRVSPETAERLRSLGYVAPAPAIASAGIAGIDPASVIDQWAAFEHALTRLNAGDAAGAVPALRALASRNTGAPLFQSTYARALAASGLQRQALDVYRDAVARWPADATLYHELAVAARAVGRAEEALRAEQASLALDPAQPAAHNGLGLLLADAGRHVDAARAFDAATKLDPTSAPYLANLGNAHRAAGDLSAAAVAYRRALDRDRGLADAANGLGVVLVQQQRAGEAIPWLEQAVTIEPSFVEARLNLGIAWQERGDPTRAAEHYRAVLAAKGPHARERDAARALLTQLGQR